MKKILVVSTALIAFSCNLSYPKVESTKNSNDSTSEVKTERKDYRAISYVDSFLNANNNDVKKNAALKEHYEGLCTRQMLALIDKKGLYDDLPFNLVVTTLHNGTAYGNFIYEDKEHFVKVTCIIKKTQLENLQENKRYLIKFNTVKFIDGVSFNNEFSRIELPSVNAFLTSFTEYTD